MQQTNTVDTNVLMVDYLNVANAAIDRHRDETPYRQLMDAAEKVVGDKKIGVSVYRDDPSKPFDYYTLKLSNGHLVLESRGKKAPDTEWKAKESYLKEVVEDPQEYIERPYKLDLDWLKTRVGLV